MFLSSTPLSLLPFLFRQLHNTHLVCFLSISLSFILLTIPISSQRLTISGTAFQNNFTKLFHFLIPPSARHVIQHVGAGCLTMITELLEYDGYYRNTIFAFHCCYMPFYLIALKPLVIPWPLLSRVNQPRSEVPRPSRNRSYKHQTISPPCEPRIRLVYCPVYNVSSDSIAPRRPLQYGEGIVML